MPHLTNHGNSRGVRTAMALAVSLLACACTSAPPLPEPELEPEPVVVVPAEESPPPAEEPPPPAPPDPVEVAAVERLAEAVALYENGEFHKAIELLTRDADIAKASVGTRVRAGKIVAFARCTLGRKLECQRDFARILALDPTFELSPFEAGNPNWEPAFKQARRASQRQQKGS